MPETSATNGCYSGCVGIARMLYPPMVSIIFNLYVKKSAISSRNGVTG